MRVIDAIKGRLRDSKYACLCVVASRAFDFEKVKVIRFKESSVLISFCYLQKQSVPDFIDQTVPGVTG